VIAGLRIPSQTVNKLMEDRGVHGAAGRIAKGDMGIKLNSKQTKTALAGRFATIFCRLPYFAGMLAK
jgi:hypothetical protein